MTRVSYARESLAAKYALRENDGAELAEHWHTNSGEDSVM